MRSPPPPRVAAPVMFHRWDRITFLHWRFPPESIQALLPAQLTVETFDGSAWVGMTPFLMRDVRAPAVPAVPWLSRFPEINVRTYARDVQGRSGIWFLSLDAARLPAVLAARASYRLPYFWSAMAVATIGNRISYRCRRRWPGPSGARCHAEVEFGPRLDGAEFDPLAHFLTARFRLFTVIAGRLAAAEVEHEPWPLHRADLRRLEQNLIDAAGLAPVTGPPVIHASPGVPVRVGMWHR